MRVGSRKLACSKEPDGCERCKRDNIACHYSEQKPMGRPRKRRHVETLEVDVAPSRQDQEFDDLVPPFSTGDELSYDDMPLINTYFEKHQMEPDLSISEEALSRDTSNPVQEELRRPDSFSNLDSTALLLNAPSLSVSGKGPNSQNAGPCACLASMYLSLASLQEFPAEIKSALVTVRSAAVTAEKVLHCPQCMAILTIEPTPPIETFQNMMLLGTILPIIANGYMRLLKMLDEETDKAIEEGRLKTFCLQEYGGLCWKDSADEDVLASTEKLFVHSKVDLQPSQWRNAVRGLLKTDIHGYEQSGFKRTGLKDLVWEMECLQRIRHGLVAPGMPGCEEDKQKYCCLQILQIAKNALDNLVIY